MAVSGFVETPSQKAYDVVIVGGAIMGASTAWHLMNSPEFDGSVLVVERSPDYARAATALSHSCIRQQFSHPLNIRISQHTSDFIRDLPASLGDARVPQTWLKEIGYLYLARTESAAEVLRQNQSVQAALGAGTRLLSRDEITERFPFYALDDVLLGSLNTEREGYWDGFTVFEWFRRLAREAGAEFLADEVTGLTLAPAEDRVTGVRLAKGGEVGCGTVVNAAGTRGARVAAMAGIDIPVEPRKRLSWLFRAETPLDRPLPLTIDASGMHVRDAGGGTYLVGDEPDPDPAADPDDFAFTEGIFEDVVWPAMAARIPAFERIRVESSWVGQYDFNTFDQNAICGPDSRVANFLFLNGYSGHGLQQAPAMGRGTAEWIVHREYRSLDLTDFHVDRFEAGRPVLERAVI